MLVPIAMIGDAFAAGFGALAALVLIGGAVLLRWQKTRLQYALLQSALEKGVTAMPGAIPLWLISLRQGFTTLVLGVALVFIGGAVNNAANKVPMPEMPATTQPAPMGMRMMPRPDGPPPRGGEDDFGGPPQFEHRGEMDGPREMQGPPPPPRQPPALEAWHRAQDQKALAKLASGVGGILVLLGLVRIIFALPEKKYTGKL